MIFVDTNVFLYAIDSADLAKQHRAEVWQEDLWRSRRGRTSFQVLQEFYFHVGRKWPKAREQARYQVRNLLAWKPVVIDGPLIERAWKIQDHHHFSFWDALIVASARTAECQYLLTEDLQNGQTIEGVQIINPFRFKPDDISA